MVIKAKTKRDICDDIKKGDEVELVPEYDYFFGKRVKEHFNVKPGEVVIKKTGKRIAGTNKEEISIIKCSRRDLDIEK